MYVSQEELNHEDELVQNRLESVDEGSIEEEPVLPFQWVLDVCSRLESLVDRGLVPEESGLGFVPDSLTLELLVGLPMESLDVRVSLREVLSSLVVVVCSDEVGALLEVVSEVEFSDRLLSSEEEEAKSSEVRALDGAVESSLCEVDSSSVVVPVFRVKSDVLPPESESERFHDGSAEEPSEPSEPSELSELLSELWSLEETSEDGGLPGELPPPPPPPPPGDERTKSVSEISPPFDGMWSGSSQRSSWGGSGHCSRGSSGPTSKRKRGA